MRLPHCSTRFLGGELLQFSALLNPSICLHRTQSSPKVRTNRIQKKKVYFVVFSPKDTPHFMNYGHVLWKAAIFFKFAQLSSSTSTCSTTTSRPLTILPSFCEIQEAAGGLRACKCLSLDLDKKLLSSRNNPAAKIAHLCFVVSRKVTVDWPVVKFGNFQALRN